MFHETHTSSRPDLDPAPALSRDDLARARFELMLLPDQVGAIPLPVYIWLEEILAGRDAAAAWLAGEIHEAVNP